VAADPRIGFWRRKLGGSDQLEQAALCLGAGESRIGADRGLQCRCSVVVGVAPELLIEGMVSDEVEDLGLLCGALEVSFGEVGVPSPQANVAAIDRADGGSTTPTKNTPRCSRRSQPVATRCATAWRPRPSAAS
jgi:hypothetical protein